MLIRSLPFTLAVSLVVAACAVSQEAPTPDTPEPVQATSDPTRPSAEFQEIAELLRDAERVRQVMAENEQLKAQVATLQERNAELEANSRSNLGGSSAVELRGLLISADKASAALLKIGDTQRVVKEGEQVTVALGTDDASTRTVLVKEIDKDGVHLEMSEKKTVIIVQ